MNFKKIAVFYQNDDYGKQGLMGVERYLKEKNIDVVAKISAEVTDRDLSTHALKLKESGAQVVILWAMPTHGALMTRPKLLMLDEPSLGLSPILVREIFSIIKTINQEGPPLLVEQNARMALSVAHFGYVLETGRIVLANTPQNLMEDEDVKEFYLGIKSEVSGKGYQRWRRKKRWR
jgi:ABC-type branched-subunit amino acid transport system ATPase component